MKRTEEILHMSRPGQGDSAPQLVARLLGVALIGASATASDVSVPIGDLQPGGRVTITYELTIDSDISRAVTQISNQGVVSGSNFSAVLTDDPETTAASDPTLTPLNAAPLADDDSLARYRNGPAKIAMAELLANDSDANRDVLAITGVISPTSNGAIVTQDGIWLIYEPPAGFIGPDTFDYIISDGRAGTDTGSVHVTIVPEGSGETRNRVSIEVVGDNVILRFIGIPGRAYQIQISPDLIMWFPHPEGSMVAGPNGIFGLNDPSPPSPRYYRALEL